MPDPNLNYLFGCPSDIYRCGGIAPVKATDDMTQPVGQKNGKLFTAPSSQLPDPEDLPDGEIIVTYDGEYIAQPYDEVINLGNIVTPGASGNVMTSTGSGWTSAAPAKELPTVTPANNGQVLMVVNGAWAAAELPAAEGEDF